MSDLSRRSFGLGLSLLAATLALAKVDSVAKKLPYPIPEEALETVTAVAEDVRWYHISYVRQNGVVTSYMNGIAADIPENLGLDKLKEVVSFPDSDGDQTVEYWATAASAEAIGYVSELRVTQCIRDDLDHQMGDQEWPRFPVVALSPVSV